MIEAVGIPILLKAVDFLFEEGRKILQERRERRKVEQGVKIADPETAGKSASNEAKVSDAIDNREVAKGLDIRAWKDYKKVSDSIGTKEAAMSQRISESVWLNSEAKITHLMSLLEIYTRNYYLAKEQYAKWGSDLAPPIIVHRLKEAEDAVVATMEDLQTALSKVYSKQFIIRDVEQE